ncbi:MAG TPA: hypothetical protein VKM55_01385 [Candidatus Lokiarchaeia archaeon]|nr:hypothetical protein [Candidatus Lokiarchaeia archaeon]
MAKDKIIGLVILLGAAALLVIYTLWLVGGYIQQTTGTLHNSSIVNWIPSFFNLPWELAVIGPMELVAILILAIAMWIGYSMLTTPPPVPLEELEEELEAEEAEEKKKKGAEEKTDDEKKDEEES